MEEDQAKKTDGRGEEGAAVREHGREWAEVVDPVCDGL